MGVWINDMSFEDYDKVSHIFNNNHKKSVIQISDLKNLDEIYKKYRNRQVSVTQKAS
jgi:hypothetical protein